MNAEKSFAMAMAGYNAETFKRRIYKCNDPDRLRAVAAYEAEREAETRSKRVGMAMERLYKITER